MNKNETKGKEAKEMRSCKFVGGEGKEGETGEEEEGIVGRGWKVRGARKTEIKLRKWFLSFFFIKVFSSFFFGVKDYNRLLFFFFLLFFSLDVAAEKTQKALLEGVEAFDTSKLKHTETNEKNPLPDKEGKL